MTAAGTINDLLAARGLPVRQTVPADPSIHGVAPAAIVTPRSAEHVAELLAVCGNEGIAVEPAGGGTWLNQGSKPTRDFVLLSTQMLAGLEDYKAEDLTVTMGAGTLLRDAASAVAQRRQWLPLDPPARPDATVGGVVATGSAGPLRAGFGTPRDHVLGLELVTGDGRVAWFGGRVVKNVAGYDMVRPITGSFGTLGVITRVCVRLRPLPAVDLPLAGRGQLDRLVYMAQQIDRAWPVSALELLSPDIASNPQWRILVRIQGHEDEVREATSRLATIMELSEIPDADLLWKGLAEEEASAKTAYRLTALPSRLAETMEIAKTLSDLMFMGSGNVSAHATAGVVRVWGETATAAAQDAISKVTERMAAIGGTLLDLHGGRPAESAGRKAMIVRQIRDVFDPMGILPGHRR